MAHLWVTNDAGEWIVQPLDNECELLEHDRRDRRHTIDEEPPDARTVAVMRITGTRTAVWILMSGPKVDVRVNGDAAAGGLRVLVDRDEISIGGVRRYFSTESLAQVVRFTGAVRAAACPRCQQSIETDSEAVKCPHCGVWHHQSDRLPCWTYADTCAVCPQPTDLSGGYRWTPADLA